MTQKSDILQKGILYAFSTKQVRIEVTHSKGFKCPRLLSLRIHGEKKTFSSYLAMQKT